MYMRYTNRRKLYFTT